MNESDRQEFITDMRESMKLEAEVNDFFDHVLRENKKQREHDPVNSPSHYFKNGLESINIIDAFVPDPYSFYMGNAIKYVLRHLDKNQGQDLEKAVWYIRRMKEEWDEGKR